MEDIPFTFNILPFTFFSKHTDPRLLNFQESQRLTKSWVVIKVTEEFQTSILPSVCDLSLSYHSDDMILGDLPSPKNNDSCSLKRANGP